MHTKLQWPLTRPVGAALALVGGRGLLALTLSIAAGLGLAACDDGAAEGVEIRDARVRIAEVRELVPEQNSRHLVLLDPWRRAQLSPRYGGQVAELLVDDQDTVQAGDLLVRLIDADARGSLMSAQASKTSASKRLDDLERQLADARELYASGAGTRREVERLETEIATTKASVRQAAGQILQSKDRKSANAILAPFSGVVTNVGVELGEYAAPGSPMLTLSELDKLAIDVPLSETEVAIHDRGQLSFEVTIRDAAVPAEVEWVAREADAGTNTFTARLRVTNDSGKLRAGESVSVSVRGTVGKPVLAVPPTAVRWEGKQAYLLRASTEGAGEEARERLERVDITVHEDVGEGVAIEGPVKIGDRVVSSGPATLVDGDAAIAVPHADDPAQAEPETTRG